MLKEVIIVEGKNDIAAVSRAVDAEMIATGGYALNRQTMEKIKIAYEKRGIIIFTDPDSAGERIRKKLTQKFPLAGQAFVAREDATDKGDIGVEQASVKSIKEALQKVRTHVLQTKETFTVKDMFSQGLSGTKNSARKRNHLGKLLGIGYTNSRQFLKRLNNYGVSRLEFESALEQLEEEDGTEC